MCPHKLFDATGLACMRTDAHDPEAVGGHVYTAREIGDRHDISEARAEASRG